MGVSSMPAHLCVCVSGGSKRRDDVWRPITFVGKRMGYGAREEIPDGSTSRTHRSGLKRPSKHLKLHIGIAQFCVIARAVEAVEF